jgi:hypothetical protein
MVFGREIGESESDVNRYERGSRERTSWPRLLWSWRRTAVSGEKRDLDWLSWLERSELV